MKTLAERLTEARTDAGLSQGALAKLAKCGQSTIASIERGRNQGSTVIPRVAEILGVSALWLAEGRGSKHPSDRDINHGHQTIDGGLLPSSYSHSSSIPAESSVVPLSTWPFKRISQARFLALPADEQTFIEGQLLAAIKDAEARIGKRSASNGR